jgi:flagellar secretion chaperone FliS
MPVNDAALTYQQVSAHGRSPVGMIVALYDTILRDFGRALTALDAGNVETRVFEMNHAVSVIGHLEEALDHQQGGEAAARFEQFYKMTRAMIVAATAKADRQSIRELIDLFVPMREAWQQAERKLQDDPSQMQATPSNRPSLAAVPSRRAPAAPSFEPEPTRGRWSA